MPRSCTVCVHPARTEIDEALLTGQPFRDIAGRFGTTKSALFRHKSNDIPVALVRAQDVAELDHGKDLFQQMVDLSTRTMQILQKAEEDGDHRLGLLAIRELRGHSELMCKMAAHAQARSDAAKAEELGEGSPQEFMDSIHLTMYGLRWKEILAAQEMKQAEDEIKIARGEPIQCEHCWQMYVKGPRVGEREFWDRAINDPHFQAMIKDLEPE